MGAELKLVVVPLLIALACMLSLHSCKGLPRQSSEVSNQRQPKQFLPISPFTQIQHPYYPYNSLYNRNYLTPQSDQLGPFFGYFPNLFHVLPTTTPSPTTTATTTTTVAPVSVTCTLAGSSDASCSPCPSGNIGGIISSSSFPGNYGTSSSSFANCIYKLQAAAGHKVKMELDAGANIERDIASTQKEFLQFYDDETRETIANPDVYPTTSVQTFTTSATSGSFLFFFNNVACSSNLGCKWQMVYSGV